MVNKQRIVSAFGFNQTPETQNVFFFYIPLSNYNCQIQVVRSNKNMLTRLLLKYILVLLSIFLRNGIYLHVNFPKKWYISHVNFLLAILNFYSMVNWLFLQEMYEEKITVHCIVPLSIHTAWVRVTVLMPFSPIFQLYHSSHF